MMGSAILLSILVMLLVTRSLRGVVVPVITAIGSIVIVYGIMGYFRFKIDSGMMLVPMLLAFAVAVAYNIHIYSYFRRRFRLHGKRKQAVVETVGEMGWPVLFSALTTFAALLSFLAIPMVPMRFVGIATSSCVMLSFLIALTVMSSMLSFGKDRTPDPKVSRTGGGLLDKCLESFGSWVLRRWKSILIVSAARLSAISSAKLAILLTLTPCAGFSSYLAIAGPTETSITFAETPNEYNVF